LTASMGCDRRIT